MMLSKIAIDGNKLMSFRQLAQFSGEELRRRFPIQIKPQESYLQVDVECLDIQLPPESSVDASIRSGLGMLSKAVSGHDLFHEVYPTMEARFLRHASEHGSGNDVSACETYRLEPTTNFICVGDTFAFHPIFIPLEGKELQSARAGRDLNLEFHLTHTPRAFRNSLLLANFSYDGPSGCSGKILSPTETVQSPDDRSRCKVRLSCTLLDARGYQRVLASSRDFTLIEIFSKLTPILAGRRGIDVLLDARPEELRSGDESVAHAELDELRQELENTMSTLQASDNSSHDAAMIDSLKLITRGLLNFSDRFRTQRTSDLLGLVIQWIGNFFKLHSGRANLNEGRLRRLLAAAQMRLHDLEPVQADGKVLPWVESTNANDGTKRMVRKSKSSDENDQMKAWFNNARHMSTSHEMEKAVLGKGSFGCVWRARSKLTGTLYAIKNVIPNHDSSQAKQVAEREAEILKVICAEGHPCIVGLFFVECAPDKTMYAHVMELCLDGDLQAKIDDGIGHNGSYTVPALAETWIGEIFMALAYLHLEVQILHRDVKPSNVVLNRNIAKLSDFGLTNRADEVEEKLGQWTFAVPPGTRLYAAPEVVMQLPYDAKADLYSFGKLIWVLVTGGVNVSPGYPPRDPQDNLALDYKQMQRCVEAIDEKRVKEIHVTESNSAEGCCRLERVTFLYSDGEEARCGGDEGQPSSKGHFLLQNGECITEVVHKGKRTLGNGTLWPPSMIQFVTNTGRHSPMYGDESTSEPCDSQYAKKSRQICALHRCGNTGRLMTVQDWDCPTRGLVPPESQAADLVSRLVKLNPEERPDHHEIWLHGLMRKIDLPSINVYVDIELEDISEWIRSKTFRSE